MHSRPNIFALSLLLAVISLTVTAAEPEPPAPSPSAIGLEGQPWLLTAYRAKDGLVDVAADSRPPRFQFESGRMTGVTGCNSLTGSYTLDGSILTIGKGLAATQMGCPPPLMTQEKAIIRALREVATVDRKGTRLDLLDARGQVLLRFAQPETPPLANRTWILQAYAADGQSLAAPAAGSTITLQLDDQGRIRGNDGCNRYMSGYTLEGKKLMIGPIATTRMACRGGEALSRQASAYADTLGRVASYRKDGAQLALLDASGRPIMRFQSEAPSGR